MLVLHSGTVKQQHAQMWSYLEMDYPVQKSYFSQPALSATLDPVCAELALHKHTVIYYIWHAPWYLFCIILSTGVLLLH